MLEVEIDSVSDQNNYKLVHASGRCSTKELVKDERFDVAQEDCVKVKRIVEVFQWVENAESHEQNGQRVTTYSYSREWKQECIDQGTFAS